MVHVFGLKLETGQLHLDLSTWSKFQLFLPDTQQNQRGRTYTVFSLRMRSPVPRLQFLGMSYIRTLISLFLLGVYDMLELL